MTEVAADRRRTATPSAGHRWGTGETLAVVSACAYAGVNALLRSVAADVDPFVASLVRQVPLLLLTTAAVLVIRPAALRPSHEWFIGRAAVGMLLGAGVVSFVVGNVFLLHGFEHVGLAVAVAAVQGGMVVGGTVLSALVLREPPTRRQLVGAGVVLVGLAVTALRALGESGGWTAVVGFVLSAAAGMCYTAANAASRSVQRRRPAFLSALALTNIGGVVVLSAIVLVRSAAGPSGLLEELLRQEHLPVLGAGLLNAVAIGAVTLAVRYTSVASVSMIAASVIVMSTLIAWLVFDEPVPAPLILGCALILAGVLYGNLRGRAVPGEPPATKETP